MLMCWKDIQSLPPLKAFIQQSATTLGPGIHIDAPWLALPHGNGGPDDSGPPQQDKAPPHTARTAQEWFKGRNKGLKVLTRPANFPDPNLIKHLWDLSGQGWSSWMYHNGFHLFLIHQSMGTGLLRVSLVVWHQILWYLWLARWGLHGWYLSWHAPRMLSWIRIWVNMLGSLLRSSGHSWAVLPVCQGLVSCWRGHCLQGVLLPWWLSLRSTMVLGWVKVSVDVIHFISVSHFSAERCIFSQTAFNASIQEAV